MDADLPHRHTPVPPALLRTQRVQLRAWRDADRAPFAQLNADPDTMAHFPAPLTRAQSDAMVERCQALMAARGWGFWAVDGVLPGAAPQFIGMVGLHVPDAALPFSPCVEVGWRLARPYWGLGLAREAAGAALRVGFEVLGLDEILAFTTLTNRRSQALMERLHMQCHPGDHFDHPALPMGHPLRAHCLYRLPRLRWQTAHGDHGPQAPDVRSPPTSR